MKFPKLCLQTTFFDYATRKFNSAFTRGKFYPELNSSSFSDCVISIIVYMYRVSMFLPLSCLKFYFFSILPWQSIACCQFLSLSFQLLLPVTTNFEVLPFFILLLPLPNVHHSKILLVAFLHSFIHSLRVVVPVQLNVSYVPYLKPNF